MVSSLSHGLRPRSATTESYYHTASSHEISLTTSKNKMTASKSQSAHSLAMQKYMLLQEQHETLCHHLDQIRPTSSAFSSPSPFSSPSTSPTRAVRVSSSSSSSRHHSRSSERRHTSRAHARCSGWDTVYRGGEVALDTIPDEETIYEISAEEQRLFDVNEGIKRALMELLNCGVVRGDTAFRKWVQTRLMETEKELRSGRRRRSS